MSQLYKIFIIFLLASSAWLATVTPPFQSPDEFEHITRAYLLGRGEFILNAPPGQSSGGEIDAGLNQYMGHFSTLPFNPQNKLTKTELDKTKQIYWTEKFEFRPALGMAYYFPAIYVVHTAGLYLGKVLKLSVDASYKITRIALLISICLVLYGSFLLHRPPISTLALLVIPMSLFQFSSASLDGIATALALFVISAFMRMGNDREKSKPWLFPLMLLAWLLIASSRLQLFPMLLLAIVASWYYLKKPLYLMYVALAAAFVIGWQIIIMKTIVDGRVKLGASTAEIISYYLHHPLRLAEVFLNTTSDQEHLLGLFSSFFGILGWLDTPFVGREYIYLLLLITSIFLLSIKFPLKQSEKYKSIILLIVAISTVAIVFFAMLVTWTPHPATFIDGVQGRYFLIPAILVSYALNVNFVTTNRLKNIVTLSLLLILCIYSLISTDQLLMSRYYELN